MQSSTELIIDSVEKGKEVFDVLKKDWFQNKLPGTYSSPSEFIACLLISQISDDPKKIAEMVKKVTDDLMPELNRNRVLPYSTFVTDSTAMLLISTLVEGGLPFNIGTQDVGEVKAKEVKLDLPIPTADLAFDPVEPVESVCPGCGHDHDYCSSGGYKSTATNDSDDVREPDIQTQPDFTKSCEHVDLDGKCTECTKEETWSCDGCSENMILSKAKKCKNFDANGDCQNAYCEDCAGTPDKPGELSKYGYCPDCDNVTCDGENCGAEIENGEQHECVGENCETPDYCDDCAKRELNDENLCPNCSGEKVSECSKCQEFFTTSKIVECKNVEECGNEYCLDHAKEEINAGGYCFDCYEEIKDQTEND